VDVGVALLLFAISALRALAHLSRLGAVAREPAADLL
jgi:hypothetical protein